MPANVLNYSFPYGEKHVYTVVAATDIDQVKDTPGLYAWYVRVLPTEASVADLKGYGDLFRSKEYHVEVRATLGERHEGKLEMSTAFDAARPTNASLISSVTTIFAPPVYVGISKTIRSRLAKHLGKLIEALHAPPPPATAAPSATAVAAPAADSDSESGHFGTRIGALLRTHGFKDQRNLFVRIVYHDIGLPEERRGAEHYANRVFFPLLGRR